MYYYLLKVGEALKFNFFFFLYVFMYYYLWKVEEVLKTFFFVCIYALLPVEGRAGVNFFFLCISV